MSGDRGGGGGGGDLVGELVTRGRGELAGKVAALGVSFLVKEISDTAAKSSSMWSSRPPRRCSRRSGIGAQPSFHSI